MKNKKLIFTSLLIFISSLLYSQRITETLLFLEYDHELDSVFVVHEEITYDPDNFISLEKKQIQTEFELPTDSNGYPIVILEPEKGLVQQTDYTTKQSKLRNSSQVKNNNLSFLYGIVVGIVITLSLLAAIYFIIWQFKHTRN